MIGESIGVNENLQGKQAKGTVVKRTKESGINRIWACVAAGCILFVAVLCVAGIWVLNASEKEEMQAAGEAFTEQETDVLVKDVEAVVTEENMLGSSFTSSSGDGKKAIRIVEVIPHPLFSVFPYMIDWETVEEYDENTFLGYDGVRYFVTQTSQWGSIGNSNLYSLTQEGLVKDTLDDYNITFIQKSNWATQVGWWREAKMDEDILNVNGYFEYVGNGKGLYHINLNELVEEGSTDLGIRYDIMAMKRKGTETKRGEWEVKNAQYFWAKDYAEKTTYPDSADGAINQKTGYNYDLKFQAGASGGWDAQYHIKTISVMTEDIEQQEGYEYAAVLAVGVDWIGGYRYSSNGNYSVKSYTPYLVNETTDLTDKYIRVNSDSKVDASGLEDGYFRLCTKEDKVTIGDTVYDVTFAETASGKSGSYILNPAAVQSAVNSDSAAALTDILFEYVGETKGNYDISFIYGPDDTSGALYSYTLMEVSNGNGRYALTSTESDVENLYEQVGDNTGDYSKVVTAIDCAGIDYTQYIIDHGNWIETQDASGYYNDKLPGLMVGRDMYNELNEHGDWVFHTVDSDEANGITKIQELERGSVPSDKRIYVYGQNRKNRYYAQNGFDNNEWFKLLLYLSSPDGSTPLAYQDYASGSLTPQQIKEKYAADIEAFNRAYRVEIIQKTPGQLTVDDVEKADLLYFAGGTESYGMAGMNMNVWNEIISKCKLSGLEAATSENMEYTDDLSAEVLQAIYYNCLYERTTSLLFSAGDFGEYVSDGRNVSSNLGKLALLANLFEDPTYFAYFMEGYSEKIEEYSTVHTNADVTCYEQNIQGIGIQYNMGSTHIQGDFNSIMPGDPIEPYRTDVWQKDYFRVVEIVLNEEGFYELDSSYGDFADGYGKYGYHWSAHGWWNFAGADVIEDDRTWYIPYLTADSFYNYLNTKNVWKILHNKKSKETSEPVVVVTNADGDNITELESVTPIYYYYVDAFALGGSNSEFDIEFRVNWRPEEIDQPNGLTNVVVTRSGGSAVFNMDGPSYKTDYVCNVAGDFIKDGTFDQTINSKEYEITATDSEGKTDTVIVRFIVRETFMLN